MTLKNIFNTLARLGGGIIPFILIHIFCCGTLLVLLISSGYLLKLSNEGQNRFLLIPALIALVLVWRLFKQKNLLVFTTHP